MADNKKRLEEMQHLLNEINKVYTSLGEKSPFGKDAKNLENSNDQVKILEDSLKGVRSEMEKINSEVSETYDAWVSIAASAKGAQKTINDSNNILSTSSNLSRQIRDHQQDTNTLSSKQLDSLKSKLESKKQDLITSQQILNEQKNALIDKNKLDSVSLTEKKKNRDTIKEINKTLKINNNALKDGVGLYDQEISKAGELLEKRKGIEKSTGVMGGVLKGISKIPILGDLVDGEEAVKTMEESFKKNGSHIGALGAGVKNLGFQLVSSALNPANLLLGAITGMVAAVMGVDKATGELAKSMNLSYSEALNARKELTSIADASGDAALNTKRLQETLTYVNNDLGTSGTLNKENLKTFTKLREQAGMSNESIQSMNKYSMVMGGSLEKNVVNFQAQAKSQSMGAGVALNTKQLMEEMVNVSNRTKMSIEGGAEGLAKAAVNAKLMGSNMAQVAAIADSLLDFESSIEKELSAELLTGKNLNLEKARTAALNNDMATVAAEITKQAGSAAEFGKMNRIQQDAIAAAMGMSADGMADMLFEQEALKSIGQSLNDEEQRAFDLAKEKYGVEEASRMLKSKAQGEGIEGLVNQQSMQEDFNQSIESMKEIFVDIAQNVIPLIQMALEPIMFVISSIASGIGLFINSLKEGKPLAIALAAVLGIMAIPLIVSAISGIFAAFSMLGPLGIPLAIAGVAGLYNDISKAKSSKMKDGIIGPGGETIVSGPKGSIQVDKDDSMIVGTDLGGKKKSQKSAGDSGGSVNIDLGPTNALLQQLISAVNAGGSISIDGQKVGEALKLGTYKTQ
jgi:hypothetical protein